MKNKFLFPFFLIFAFSIFFLTNQIFAQTDTTEHERIVSESEISSNILPNLGTKTNENELGFGIDINNPQNTLNMNNPRVTLTSGLLTLSADSFVESYNPYDVHTYNNFSISGSLSEQGGKFVFIKSTLQPNNVPNLYSNGIVYSISSALSFYYFPESSETFKCLKIEQGQLLIVYETNEPNPAAVPGAPGFCDSGGQGGGGSGGGSGGGNYTPPEPVDLSTSGGGLSAACPKTGCGFNELMEMVNKVIHFILFDLAMPIAAIMFAYAGFLLITSGGNPETKNKAKKIFWNVFIGFVIALAAWLIVKTILSTLGYTGTSFLAD